MKLLVGCVPFDHGKSGISVYIRSVVAELAAAGHDLTLIVEPDAAEEFARYKQIVLPQWAANPLFCMVYHLFILPFFMHGKKYDKVLMLAANRRMVAWCGSYLVAVVHDLSQYHVPVKYDKFRMFYIKKVLPYFVRNKADMVAAISESTAADLKKFWQIPAGKIVVNYNGFNRSKLPLNSNDGAEKVVLYVSRLESPGKNHINLIKAWELLPPEITGEYKLVLAGADWNGAEQIHAAAENSPVKASIVFTGFVQFEQLYDWYKHCRLYVFPSFFEGFGLSLVEAMACGLVCACSNNSSLGEIGQGAALLFDPNSPPEIAAAIKQGLTNDDLRADLRQKGLLRSEQFSWRKHAECLVKNHELYAEVLGVKFSTCTMKQALENIAATVKNPAEKCKIAAFVNADCLNQAYKNQEYKDFLNTQADYVWADGIGVNLGAKYKHTAVQENVNGTDMFPLLCESGYRLYLLGGRPGVAEEARKNAVIAHPKATIVGAEDGYIEGREADVIARINAAKTDILLVAMGVPKQEQFIARHQTELTCKLAIGVGGLLDFVSGRIPRAPLWMRKLKLEWVFRLACEPRRLFRRYVIGNPVFLWRVWREKK